MQDTIIPHKLEIDDTIGIISPSKAPRDNEFNKERTYTATKFINNLGLKVKFAKHWEDRDFFGGAKFEDRIQDIHDMFLDKDVKMIIMSVGGHYSNSVIPHLDYKIIRNNPKIFSGFSDGTLLTNAIYKNSGIQTYYGLNFNDTLGFEISEATKQNFINTFMSDTPYSITENYNLTFIDWSNGEKLNKPYNGWNIIKPGIAKGKLTGGLMARLITTDYAGFNIDYNNKIMFFESVAELKKLFIELTSMEQKGVFKQINGLIVGHCTKIEDPKEVADMVSLILKNYNFPIIQIGELGHNVENYSFPIGAMAELDTNNKIIKIQRS